MSGWTLTLFQGALLAGALGVMGFCLWQLGREARAWWRREREARQAEQERRERYRLRAHLQALDRSDGATITRIERKGDAA